MNSLPYLQNALLLGAAFAVFGFTGTWWGFWLLIFWLSPSSDCKCGKDDDK